MNFDIVLRVIILIGSALVSVFGVLVIVGMFIPRNIPNEHRIVLGAIIFLYGVYRFVVAFYRRRNQREHTL
jgi:hypothetical protein